MIFEKQDGEDRVFMAHDRSFGGAATEAYRVNGSTGKMTFTAGAAMPGTQLHELWDKEAADAAASTTLAEHVIVRATGPMKVAAVYYVPDATLTASDTTYATITVSVRNADGTNQQTVASVTTKTTGGGGSGNWSAFVAVALAVTAANVNLVAGQILTVSIAKASTGVVVPAGQLVVAYTLA